MYEFYSFLRADAASRLPRQLPDMSLDGIVRLAVALALIAAVVTLLDYAVANQAHSVVAANALDPIQWEK